MFKAADLLSNSDLDVLVASKASLAQNSDADKIVELCRKMIEAVEGEVAPGSIKISDKKTEHANLKNIFRTFAGNDASEKFSLPWYYKLLNPLSTFRNSFLGVESNFSQGQPQLYKNLTEGRADVPGWLYKWAPKAWQPSIRDKCNNFLRPIVGFFDFLPFRAINAFGSSANAQFEHLTQLQEFSMDVFHRKRSVLQREIHKILLRNTPEFAESICYRLFEEGLTAPNYSCDQLSPENLKIFKLFVNNNQIPKELTALEFKDQIVNFQKLQACKLLAERGLGGLFKQGNNRLAFLGANLVDGLAYPKTTQAHKEAMGALVQHSQSRQDKIKKIELKGWGVQPPLALMIRQIIDHGFYRQNTAKALVDQAPIFEVDKNNTSAFELYFNTPTDISFSGTDRVLEKLANSNEESEWSFMPGSGHLGTLKYEKPLVRRMHCGEHSLRFKQQSAADFFVNTIADAFITIDASEARLANGKNDNPLEVDYLAGHYRRLQVATDAFFQHCRAFIHVNKGILPSDVCDAAGLPNGSKVSDLIGQVIKRVRPYYENHHRFVDIRPENLDKIDPTWIDPRTKNDPTGPKPFAYKTINVMTGKVEEVYRGTNDAERKNTQACYNQAKAAYTQNINNRLTDVSASHQRIAGIINSMTAQYGAAKKAAENIISKLPNQEKVTDYPYIKITRPTKESRYTNEQVVEAAAEERGYRAVVSGGGMIQEYNDDDLLLELAKRQAFNAAARC